MRQSLPVVPLARQSWRRTLIGLTAGWLTACQLPDDMIARRLSNGGADSTGGSGPVPVAGSGNQPTADAGGGSGPAAGAAGGGGADAGSPDACTGFVPTVSATLAGGVRQEMCAGWIARRAFSHAVCSCGDLNVLAVLASDARDSSTEVTKPDRIGAAVGVNGSYSGGEYLRIGGSFTVKGPAALASRGGIDVAGDLRVAPAVSAAGPIFVGRDAWVLQAASSLSVATVGRDLHLGPSGALTGPAPALVGGKTLHESYDIAAPCSCAAQDLVDIAGIVDEGLTNNDNGRLGLGLDTLSDGADPIELALSCGRFAFRSVAAEREVHLRVSGRVLLFVDGDVDAGRSFSLELEPGAELDWFIRGNLSVSGESLIGDNARPGATRVYVLGSADIALPGTARFSANVYAPRARLTIGALGDVYGAVFGASVSSLGPLLAHYDRTVLEADADCALAPNTVCSSCDQCGAGKACVGSVCTACTVDSDCCFPLACNMGRCQALNAD
jgi:hypothetical protein